MGKELEYEFEIALIELSKRIRRETDYNPTRFIRMISSLGPIATAKALINSKDPSEGYTKLWELKKLNLTVEAFVLENPRWHQLFTESELDRAKQRLLSFKYEIK